jgi:hypothetical protein
MPKAKLEFTDTAAGFQWRPVPGAPPGIQEKTLSRDPLTGDCTRLVRFPVGFKGREILTHDFWEEVFILEGSFHDVNLKRTFLPGSYACRPPGMPHGPYECPAGCLAFEIRYHKK